MPAIPSIQFGLLRARGYKKQDDWSPRSEIKKERITDGFSRLSEDMENQDIQVIKIHRERQFKTGKEEIKAHLDVGGQPYYASLSKCNGKPDRITIYAGKCPSEGERFWCSFSSGDIVSVGYVDDRGAQTAAYDVRTAAAVGKLEQLEKNVVKPLAEQIIKEAVQNSEQLK